MQWRDELIIFCWRKKLIFDIWYLVIDNWYWRERKKREKEKEGTDGSSRCDEVGSTNCVSFFLFFCVLILAAKFFHLHLFFPNLILISSSDFAAQLESISPSPLSIFSLLLFVILIWYVLSSSFNAYFTS